jgi:hypothetical protein
MQTRTVTLVAISIMALTLAADGAPAPVVVGVLENPQCARTERPDTLVVRALFAKTGAEWTALDSRKTFEQLVSREMSWTISFDGRNLGSIRTLDRRPEIEDDRAFVRDRTLELVAGGQPPRRPNPAGRFNGWCNPVPNRPLIVVSATNFQDPEGWKPFSHGRSVLDTLLPAFRAAVGSISVCPGDAENFDNARPFRFTARDLRIVHAYRNRVGRSVVGIEFADTEQLCQDPTTHSYSTHWFLLSGGPVLLGAGLQLVDAGDYDGDGESEVVFAYSGYNRDGYTLFTDAFRKRAEVRWSYH